MFLFYLMGSLYRLEPIGTELEGVFKLRGIPTKEFPLYRPTL